MIYQVYYANERGERFFEFDEGESRNLNGYTRIGELWAQTPYHAFMRLQHGVHGLRVEDFEGTRSLSVGDLLKDEDGNWHAVARVGFHPITFGFNDDDDVVFTRMET